MLYKLKIFYQDLVNVSKLTKTNNKKKSVLLLALLINLQVVFDIFVILYFSYLFSEKIQLSNIIVDFFIERTYFLPLFIILRFLFIYFEKIVTTKLQISIESNLRTHLLNEVFTSGNVSMSDAYFYVNTLSAQVGVFYSTLATFFGSFIQIVVFTLYLLFSNFQTVLIFSIGSILLFFPTIYLTKKGRKYAHIAYESSQKISLNLEKVLDNLFLIKILKYVNNEVLNFKISLQKYYDARMSDVKVGTANTLMPNFLTLLILSILLVFFDFVKILTFDFIGILLRLFQSLGVFNKNIHTVSSFHVYLEKLYEIEKNKKFVTASNFIVDTELKEETAIVFKNVSFRYLGSEVEMFQNLNLTIPKNEHTIITGPNGSGKSTLIGLISGTFYASSGTVTSFTNKYGYVSASPMIINSNIKENILYGSEKNISDEILINYLEKFKVFNDEDVIDLNKRISNKKLSMGQMQKISFIRALISGVDILVLDESMSNLDLGSKKLIFDILSEKEITIINSTHSPEDFQGHDNHIVISVDDNLRRVSFNKLT